MFGQRPKYSPSLQQLAAKHQSLRFQIALLESSLPRTGNPRSFTSREPSCENSNNALRRCCPPRHRAVTEAMSTGTIGPHCANADLKARRLPDQVRMRLELVGWSRNDGGQRWIALHGDAEAGREDDYRNDDGNFHICLLFPGMQR